MDGYTIFRILFFTSVKVFWGFGRLFFISLDASIAIESSIIDDISQKLRLNSGGMQGKWKPSLPNHDEEAALG